MNRDTPAVLTSMDQYKREFFVSRICSGNIRYKYNGGTLIIKSPPPDILYEANELYNDVYKRAIEDNIISNEDATNFLISRGIWCQEDDRQLEEILPKHIEYFKVEIYEKFDNEKVREQTRKYLNKAIESIGELYSKKHMYDYLTCHGIASFSKYQFIIENTTFKDNKLFDWSDCNITTVMSFVNSSQISEKVIREISRHDPWKSIWISGKKNNGSIFSSSAIELTEDQKRLISWSSLYDNVMEHEDCPPNNVIEDDDAFDGWMIVKSKESKRNKEVSSVEKRVSKKSVNAPEVFYVASDDDPNALFSKSEISKIYGLNDASSKNIISQRLDIIKNKGEVSETEFPDTQRELSMARTRAMSQAMRRK